MRTEPSALSPQSSVLSHVRLLAPQTALGLASLTLERKE